MTITTAHSEETLDLAFTLIKISGGEILKAIETANLLRFPAQLDADEGTGDPDGVRKLDDAILALRDLREQQLEAGRIIRQARAKRAEGSR